MKRRTSLYLHILLFIFTSKFNAPIKMNTHGNLNFQSILYSQNKATLNKAEIQQRGK